MYVTDLRDKDGNKPSDVATPAPESEPELGLESENLPLLRARKLDPAIRQLPRVRMDAETLFEVIPYILL